MIILQNRGSIIHKDGSASIYKLFWMNLHFDYLSAYAYENQTLLHTLL